MTDLMIAPALDDEADELSSTPGEELTEADLIARRAQAEERLETLSRGFAQTMSVVAMMHRDEDWRYLTREDGTPYKSLAQVVAVVTKRSPAMARRYVQGARDLYLPLTSIVVDGTSIDIDSRAVQELGQDGAATVVERVTARIQDVDDAGAQSEIIRGTVDEVREERAAHAAAAKGPWVDPFSSDDGDQEGEWNPRSDGPSYCGKDAEGDPCFLTRGHEGMCDPYPESEPPQPVSFDGQIVIPNDDPVPDVPGVEEVTVESLIQSGADYRDEAALAELPRDLRPVVEALITLTEVDPLAFAKLLSWETRGVGRLFPPAASTLVRLRSYFETQPFLVSRL